MNIAEAKKRVEDIREMSGDDEGAHAAEDQLYADFVWYVSENCPKELAEVAREILKTQLIDFARWCA